MAKPISFEMRTLPDGTTCPAQTTEWSPCSRECGWGIRERVTNNNDKCDMRKETVLCQLRPCHYEPTIMKMLNVWITYSSCKICFHFSLIATRTACAWRLLDPRTRSSTASLDANRPKSTSHATVDSASQSQNAVPLPKLRSLAWSSGKFWC